MTQTSTTTDMTPAEAGKARAAEIAAMATEVRNLNAALLAHTGHGKTKLRNDREAALAALQAMLTEHRGLTECATEVDVLDWARNLTTIHEINARYAGLLAEAEAEAVESYAAKRSRIEAENDAFRARGSKLARKLLALMTARMDAYAKGPKAEAIAIARLEGAAEALAALHGYTPHAWEMAVIRPWQLACKTANRPVMSHGLGGNQAILAWEAEVAEAIDAELAKLGL